MTTLAHVYIQRARFRRLTVLALPGFLPEAIQAPRRSRTRKLTFARRGVPRCQSLLSLLSLL